MSRSKLIADGSRLTEDSIPDRSSSQNLIDRRAIKRSLGIPVNILDYALAGTTDFTTAINNAIIDVGVNGDTDKRLELPAGSYTVTDTIVMDYPITFYGDHMSRCWLMATHANTGLHITGKYGNGPQVKDLSIIFDTGGGNSVAHIIVDNYQNPGDPNDYYSPDFLVLSGLNLTGFNNSTVSYNIRLNGSNRSNSNGGIVPIGLRDLTLSNIQAFNATFRGIEYECCRVAHNFGVNVFQAAGVGKMAVFGDSPTFVSDTVTFFGCAIGGEFFYSNTNNVKLYGCTTGSISSAGTNNGFVNL